MDGENFERWEPVGGLEPEMALEAMRDDGEGFRVILREQRFTNARTLRIAFDEAVCYRTAQDARFVARVLEDAGIYPWPIFVVENSRYLAWYYGQAKAPPDHRARHYHIATETGIVDVIAERPPVVAWLDAF